MHILYVWFFPVVWIAYLVYWQFAAGRVKATQRIESVPSRVFRTVLLLAGVTLLSWPGIPIPGLNRRFLPDAGWTFVLGAAITVAGLLFSIWARVTLGANWSRSVTIKQDHELITFGPYSLVRHPIYTGLLTAFLGFALAIGQYRALAAFVLIFLSLGYKLLLEEKWMRSQFGDIYLNYTRHTAALIPWLL